MMNPTKEENAKILTFKDIIPVDFDVFVSVHALLFVEESQSMKKLMNDS